MANPRATRALAFSPEVEPKAIESGIIWANMAGVLVVAFWVIRPTPSEMNQMAASAVNPAKAARVGSSLACPVKMPKTK